MKKSSLFPADIYQVVNKCLLSEEDKLILSMLYMPIIGNTAVSLYLTLFSELKASNYMSNELNHHHLMTVMNLSLEEIKNSRIKLEGIGLLKTYFMEGNINSYVYELYSPLSAHEFFSHPIFNMVLYNNVGKEEYNRISNYFKMPSINLKGYEEITSAFDMTFKSKDYTNFEENNKDIICKRKLKLNYDRDYDFDLLINTIPSKIFNSKSLTKSVRELIVDLSFLYEIEPLVMADIIKTVINEKGLIDKEELRCNTRKYYQYNHENKLPSLIYKSQPEYLKSPNGDNSNRGKMIKSFESYSPYEFLKFKYKGAKPASQDMKVLETLVVDLKLNSAVVNVLIDYVLKTNNNKFTKNYVETIAGQWKRCGVETAKEAMELAEKEHKKVKKIVPNSQIKKQVPSWFNENIKSKEVSENEKNELEELLKEFK
jgi:replication initiation and membrane attachment protein